jgi:hypothetical protein
MINPLSNYFSAEKWESVIFIAVGLVAIGAFLGQATGPRC